MAEIAPESNPLIKLSENGFFNTDGEYWQQQFPQLTERLRVSGGEDFDAINTFGWGFFHTRQLHEAMRYFQQVMNAAPETAGADLGYFLVLQQQLSHPEAIRFALNAWSHQDRHIYQFYLSILLLEVGNAAEAHEYMENWFGLAPYLMEFRYLKSRILSAVNQWDEAVVVLSEMLKDGDQNPASSLDLLRAVSHANPSSTVENNIKTCRHSIGVLPPEAWSRYHLARSGLCSDVAETCAEKPDPPLKPAPNFKYAVATSNRNLMVHADTDIQAVGSSWTEPVIDTQCLRQNIAAFKDRVEELIRAGQFEIWIRNIEQFHDAFCDTQRSPVFILSTGRCGSFAFQQLMEKSSHLIAYHTLPWQLSAADRNNVLYRINQGDFEGDALCEILQSYLECRVAEYLDSIQSNKTLAISNHLDTVFAPFNAVFYPHSRFIYLHRDPVKVYRSLLTKNQWGGQLQHWYYDPSFPEDRFHYRAREDIPVEAEIAWYIYLTKIFAEAFLHSLPDERHVTIRSEDMFSGDTAVFDRLKTVLPLDDLTEEDFVSHFSQPINTKDTLVDGISVAMTDDAAFQRFFHHLEQNNSFDGLL